MKRRYANATSIVDHELATSFGDDLTGENFESEQRVTCGVCGEDIGPAYQRSTRDVDWQEDPYHFISHWPEESRKRWKRGAFHKCWASNYDAAARYLELGRSKTDRPVANNTRLVRRSPNEIAVCLHGTDVITMFDTGAFAFTTGTWDTVTTRNRLRYCRVYGDFATFRFGGDLYWGVRARTTDGRYWLRANDDTILWRPDTRQVVRFDPNGVLDPDSDGRPLPEIAAEHEVYVREKRRMYGKLRGYQTRVRNALAGSLAVNYDDCPANSEELLADIEAGVVRPGLILRVVSRMKGDTRHWLNFHVNGEVRMGECEPLVRKLIAKKVYEAAKRELIA